ncbi:MAG: DUF2779 domain-containing protein [Deltaproteobacteria bacterium]|nr:DUF2779 domain-containing protein [Deltaproteobacteria bacterium]
MPEILFEQGQEIGRLAWKRFPGGRLIEADHLHGKEALQATRAAVEDGAKILYEAAAFFDDVLVRADILVRNGDGSWDIIEVKSSTRVDEVHLKDLSIQRYVLEGGGFRIRKTCLMFINNQYVRRGEINVDQLFSMSDVTKEVSKLIKEVPANVKEFHKTVVLGEAPSVDIGAHCSDPHDCEFINYCWKHVPKNSIYDLAKISETVISRLKAMGVLETKDIPEGFELTETQAIQVKVAKTGQEHLEAGPIAKSLKGLSYPLHFLDFETINPAVPPYDRLRPYEQLPFQASIHIQKTDGGRIEHVEFLGDGKNDPRPGLAKCLVEVIGPKGSVIAYNASFEGRCIAGLADAFPEMSDRLLSIKGRLWDVADAFSKRHYVHPGFQGRWSMKAVLPTLVPSMAYDNLAIGGGTEAQLAYLNLMKGKYSDSEAVNLAADLKKYCGQDTLGMVELLACLRRKLA